MAIQDMYPQYMPTSNPTYTTGGAQPPQQTSGDNWMNLPGFLLNAYGAYKDRDVQGDVSKNLGKGYTSGEGALVDWLSPYADRGNMASDRYGGLADQYQPGGPGLSGDLGLKGLDLEQFDPSQLRDMEYLKNTPGYQFRLEQGRAERENAAAGRGLNMSTNILRDLDQYGQDMASQEYEKEYGRLRDMYGVNRDTSVANYEADQKATMANFEAQERAKLGNYNAEERARIQQMQNYLPLMSQGPGAASTIGQGIAQMEVARGGANAAREMNQGTISNQFLGSVTPGGPGKGTWSEQMGLDNLSFEGIGNAFGNVRDWFGEGGGEAFAGDWDNFWTGMRDFELGDLEGIFSDFF